MKNIIKTVTLLLLVIATASSCKKDDSPSLVDNTIQKGNWKITFFQDSGNDETSHFSGYEFIFNSGGSVTASNGNNSVSGTWTTGTDDSQSKLILNFGSTAPFDELNEDWHVLEETTTMIRCEHISGGNGGTDYLTFEKI
jgi:hypothetical protein